MSLLSRFVITFLSRSKCLLISWLQSSSTVILESKKIKSVTASTISPSVYHEVVRPNANIFIFWMLNFKPAFSFSSFTHIKRLFSSSSLSAISVVSSAYLRMLIFIPAVLIPACDSSHTHPYIFVYFIFCLLYFPFILTTSWYNRFICSLCYLS